MRQGITTKFLGPTNSRGSRIKAIARKASSMGAEMSHTRPYQYEGAEKEHALAAKELAEKLGWSGLWIGGGNVSEDGYVFVNLPSVSAGPLPYATEDVDWFVVANVEAKQAA
jgi:hypothetical protein